MAVVTRFLQGSVWMIGMRWAVRCVGLVSTVILARILTPDDFGIVAMASIVFGLLQLCADMGTWQLLLRIGDADTDAYHTAWTITLLQSLLLAVAVVFAAYPAALYFSEARLVPVLQVLALTSVVRGFGNIGTVMFRRDLDFRSDFLLGLYAKIGTVVPTVVLALIYRSYWAMIAGMVIGTVIEVAISYAMHPFRPRWRLDGWRRFVAFSLWMTPSNVASYLHQKIDVLIVGFIASTAQMGAYNVASELSRMATAEVVMPMARALFPNYSKLKDNLAELTKVFLMVLRSVTIFAFGFGFGIAAVAEDVVYLVLGDQWGSAVPLIFWLGISGTFAAVLYTASSHILIVLGGERVVFLQNLLRLAILAACVLPASRFGDTSSIAIAVAVSTGVFTFGFLAYLPRHLPVSASNLLWNVVQVFVAALIMLFVVMQVHELISAPRPIRLIADAAIGAAVYCTVLVIFWFAAGKPDGPEQRLLAALATRWANHRA